MFGGTCKIKTKSTSWEQEVDERCIYANVLSWLVKFPSRKFEGASQIAVWITSQ